MKWIAAVVGLLAIVVFVYVAMGKGVKVELENVSSGAITSVRVQVKGAEYTVGDIDSGESDSVKVEPTAATDEVRVRWVGPDGKEHFGRVPADIDPGSTHGTITIQVGDSTLKGNKVELDSGFF